MMITKDHKAKIFMALVIANLGVQYSASILNQNADKMDFCSCAQMESICELDLVVDILYLSTDNKRTITTSTTGFS